MVSSEGNIFKTIHYYYYDFWQVYSHPVTGRLPLVDGGPWKLFAIVLLYYMFVKHWGPAYMKHRQPYHLKWVMVVHNVTLVLLNGVCLLVSLPYSRFGLTTWDCRKYDAQSKNIGEHVLMFMGYTYYISKFLDLSDTVFFVLRKKFRNISGLHVFHHAMMPFAGWVGLKFSAYHCAGFIPFINAFIHTIMYTYYALAALGRQDVLWWKKYLTQMQMVQFVLIFCHALYFLNYPGGCDWPIVFPLLEASHGLLFFYLFYTFYRRNYVTNMTNVTNITNKASSSGQRLAVVANSIACEAKDE